MLNKNGNTENLEEFHSNGESSYDFYTDSNGYHYEWTLDKNGNMLTFKNSDGYSSEYTYDKNGYELTYKNSEGESRGLKEDVQTGEQVQEKIEAVTNDVEISRELADGLLKYFTEKPHLIEEIEYFVNGLRRSLGKPEKLKS